MASNGSQLRQLLKRILVFGISAADDVLADGTVCQSTAAKTVWYPANATAATVARFTIDNNLAAGILVQSVSVVGDAVITLNASNYATFSLVYNNGAAGADTTIASFSTSATTTVAEVANAMTLTAANLYVPPGSQLDLVIAKAGTGVATPNLSFAIKGVFS